MPGSCNCAAIVPRGGCKHYLLLMRYRSFSYGKSVLCIICKSVSSARRHVAPCYAHLSEFCTGWLDRVLDKWTFLDIGVVGIPTSQSWNRWMLMASETTNSAWSLCPRVARFECVGSANLKALNYILWILLDKLWQADHQVHHALKKGNLLPV